MFWTTQKPAAVNRRADYVRETDHQGGADFSLFGTPWRIRSRCLDVQKEIRFCFPDSLLTESERCLISPPKLPSVSVLYSLRFSKFLIQGNSPPIEFVFCGSRVSTSRYLRQEILIKIITSEAGVCTDIGFRRVKSCLEFNKSPPHRLEGSSSKLDGTRGGHCLTLQYVLLSNLRFFIIEDWQNENKTLDL